MTYKCVIIDDEPLAAGIIEEHIKCTPSLHLERSFTNPVKAYEYLSEYKTDILFIDIQMPDLSGIELVKQLEFKPAVIFTTAFDQYALEGFRVDAMDYLLKPVDYPEFLKAVEKAKKWLDLTHKVLDIQQDNQFLFIKSEHRVTRIELNAIKFIEGMSEYVRIHREHEKPVMTLLSIRALESHLPKDQFMRIHKSYLVNLTKIKDIENNFVTFGDGKILPVSKAFKPRLLEFINHHTIR